MTEKELQELKRQFKWENDKFYLSRVGVAYAKISFDGREIQSMEIKDFSLLSEEEGELYLAAFKKALSGTMGKNLVEYEFSAPVDGEHAAQHRLYAFREDQLKSEDQFRELCEDIINKGQYTDNVCILAAACEYSVPLKTKNDEDTMEEAGKYRFVLVSVHPASLTRIGLVYDRPSNSVQRKINDDMQIETAPLDAFLYPCFTDRGADVNHVLYHCKNEKSFNADFVQSFLQCENQVSSLDQKDGFRQVLQGMFDNRLKAETILNLHNNITDDLQENAEETGMLTYSKGQVRELLEASGADEESLSHFSSVYSLVMDDRDIAAVNMTDKSRIVFKTPSIHLSVKNDGASQVSLKLVDGKKYLMIAVDDDVEIDGLSVSL